MKIVTTECNRCGIPIRNNSLIKHQAVCNGSPSWFVRKRNNLEAKVPKKIQDVNWDEVQKSYDDGMSTAELCRTYHINFNKISDAGKQGLFKTRLRSETVQLRGTSTKGRVRSKEERQRISESMKRAVAEGRQRTPKPYGRACITYNGIVLQSKWELQVAVYLDENNIKWERPTEGHAYIFEGDMHSYFPDFYLPERNLYIEVKGWVQPKDVCKWEQFKHNLLIIDKDNIKNLDNAFKKW